MLMPGFTAEASLYQSVAHYPALGTVGHASGGIVPAICDPDCLDNCLEDCSDCYDLPARYRWICIRYCHLHNAGCIRHCCH
jgi:hypothetical protein